MEEQIKEEVEELEKKKVNLEIQLNEMKKEKKHIQKIIKKKLNGNSNKKQNSYSNNGNVVRRMSNNFYSRMDNIDKKRERLNSDFLSLPKKTELLVRHILWKEIEDDLINFKLNSLNSSW